MKTIILVLLIALPIMADEKIVPKVRVGRETTYIDGPLDKDGYIDYESAINERMKRGIKPESNANVLLFKAFGPKAGGKMPAEFFEQLAISVPPDKGDYLIGHYVFTRDHLKLKRNEEDDFGQQHNRATKRPWKAVDRPHSFAWLVLNEKPLAVVVEATKRPEYFNPLVSFKKAGAPGGLINYSFQNVSMCRELASLLCSRAMLRVGEAKYDNAWQDLLACHRLGRLVARGGTLMESLVGIGIVENASNATLAYLENAMLTSAELLKHITDLQALPAMPPMADKIGEGERSMCLDYLQVIRRGGPKELAEMILSAVAKEDEARAQLVFTTIDWEPAFRNCNRWYNRLTDAWRGKTHAERKKQIERIHEELETLVAEKPTPSDVIKQVLQGQQPAERVDSRKISDLLVRLLMPTSIVQSTSDRCEQTQRNLHVAFALAAYHRDNKRYPGKLEDLAPKYLAAVPNDIFSGKALKYRPAEKGYLLYSIGVNGKDEEGRWFDDDPPGDDPRVIMPLPELKIRR